MNLNNLSERKRQHMVGLAKKLFDEGLTTKEVAAKMCISESSVRSLKKIIDKAETNRLS